MNAMTSSVPTKITPIGWAETFAYFFFPALVLIGCFYWLMPALISSGVLPFYAYSLSFLVLFLILFIASLVVYRLEGNPWDWGTFRSRMRLQRMSARDWLWTTGIFLLALALFFLMQPITTYLINNSWIPIPVGIPDIANPLANLSMEQYSAAAGGVRGNLSFLLVSTILLVLNILAEELWWRGVILPRQEISLGRKTWWIHGLLWNLFHAAIYWNLLNLLPLTLGLAFVASRRRSTTVGIITHAFHKFDFFIIVLPLFLYGTG